MKKVFSRIFVTSFSIFAMTFFGCTNEKDKAKVKVKNADSQVVELKDEVDGCEVHFLLLEDTLAFIVNEIREVDDRYDAQFEYPVFTENNINLLKLNQEIESMVFDEFPDSKTYFSNFLKEYQKEFKNVVEDEKYSWSDMETIELILNTPQIISMIHHDFEWKSGGAIGFGHNIGFNYDLKNNTEIKLEEIIDTSKWGLIEIELEEIYKKEFNVESLSEKKTKISITKNICLDKKGINFIYQRFEYDNIGGAGMGLQIPYCKIKDALIRNSILTNNLGID